MALNFKLIGRRIKEIRKCRHVTQAILAERIDKSVPYISHIETATKQASLTTLVLIANALDVTVDTFLDGNQVNDKKEHLSEAARLLEGCNSCERRFILDVTSAIKSSMQNYHLPRTDEKKP